jgi:hypothetical protein
MRETVIVFNHVLKSEAVMKVELNNDEQVADWDRVDRLEDGERAMLKQHLEHISATGGTSS